MKKKDQTVPAFLVVNLNDYNNETPIQCATREKAESEAMEVARMAELDGNEAEVFVCIPIAKAVIKAQCVDISR